MALAKREIRLMSILKNSADVHKKKQNYKYSHPGEEVLRPSDTSQKILEAGEDKATITNSKQPPF